MKKEDERAGTREGRVQGDPRVGVVFTAALISQRKHPRENQRL